MGLFRRKLALVTSLLFFCLLHVAFCEVGFCSDLILDPGHSPGKPGATSCSGLPEYQFNDQLVSTIERFLAERGLACDVTRRGREELSLKERGAKARGHKLFLSVHHDSVQPFYLERMHGQLCSRKAHGYALFVSRKNAYLLYQVISICRNANRFPDALQRPLSLDLVHLLADDDAHRGVVVRLLDELVNRRHIEAQPESLSSRTYTRNRC